MQPVVNESIENKSLSLSRLLEIEEKFETKVERIIPVEFDEETLRVSHESG